MADPTLDDVNPIPKRTVFSDGSNGQAATPVPVMAAQNLNTASALPDISAKAIVQPNTAAPVAAPPPVAPPTLGSASPIANPSRGVYTDNTNNPAAAPPIVPVAAPAAAAAAAAPVTPPQPVGGASQIPGTPAPGTVQPPAATGAYPNVGGVPVGSQTLADTVNYYGGKALDAVAANAPALGPLGQEVGAGIQGLRGISNVVRAVPRTVGAALNVESRAAPAEAQAAASAAKTVPPSPGAPPAGTVPTPGVTVTEGPNLAGAGTPLTAEQQAAQSAATAQRASSGVNTGGAAGAVDPVTGQVTGAAGNAASGLSTAQKAARVAGVAGLAGLVGTTGVGIYEAGDPGPKADPNINGYPNTMGAPLDPKTGQPVADATTPTLNDVTKVGNSYSGTNISGVPTINGQPITAGGSVGGPSPTAEQAAAAHTANLASIASDSQAIKDRLAAASANDQGLGNATFDASRTGGDDYAKFTEQANLNTAKQATGWSPTRGTTVNEPALKAAQAAIDNRAKKEAEQQKTATTLASQIAENARAAATNATTQRGQDLVARTAANNTLATLMGQGSVSKTAQDKLDYEKMKDDKQFKIDEVKRGVSNAADAYKIRQESMDNVIKTATRMRPQVDGKADADGAARDAAAVNAYMADVQTRLETALKTDPTNTAISNKLDNIKRYGARELDQTDIERVVKGNIASELATKAQGATLPQRLYAGTQGGSTSDVPVQHIVKQVRLGMPDTYAESDVNGKPIPGGRIIPADMVEGNQGWLNTGVFAQPNANLQSIIVRPRS